MNQIEGLLLLTGIPLILLLSGYWLAVALSGSEVATRLSVGLLTGIAVLLLAVSIVNFFVPLSGLAGWSCLLPALFSLGWKKSRHALGQDLRAFLAHYPGWAYALVVVVFFGLLLWPVFSSSTTVMYDGTSNHDSFFWVVVAEHLKRHTYMEQPMVNALQPLASAADAVVGWRPAWGRMGSEGLIALCSAVVGLSPLKLYVYVTACLFFPWLAAVHLAIRVFYAEKLSWLAQASVLLFHPIFFFFYANSNLPNLLGVIAGTTAIVSTEAALRTGRERRGELLVWCGLLALSLHGGYCAYSEMIPFVFMSCGLLWLRIFFRPAKLVGASARWPVAAAVVVSTLLNPASSLRAGWGFYAAYLSARADDRWGNIMDQLHPLQYLPALATLAPSAAKWLGIWAGGSLSLLMVVGLGLAWRRAHDPLGAWLAGAGGCALLLYTLLARFVYGWQKSVQFTGILVSAVLAGVLVDALYQYQHRDKMSRGLARGGAAALVAFLAFAVGMQCRELYKWSERKLISQDWFVLREQSRTHLNTLPVLVEAASFRMAFYHGMWAAYFLPDSHIYFAARGDQSGGYLRGNVINEASQSIPEPAAVLVGRTWADTFDANSRRILTGLEYALLRESNRVFTMRGVFPLNGPPDLASTEIEFEVLPHSASELQFELRPLKPEAWPTGAWQITRRAEGSPEFSLGVTGAPPWSIRVPLVAGQKNQIGLSISNGKGPSQPWPFSLTKLRTLTVP